MSSVAPLKVRGAWPGQRRHTRLWEMGGGGRGDGRDGGQSLVSVERPSVACSENQLKGICRTLATRDKVLPSLERHHSRGVRGEGDGVKARSCQGARCRRDKESTSLNYFELKGWRQREEGKPGSLLQARLFRLVQGRRV